MTSSSTPDARDLINLAERMGIPVDEAIRQVAQLVADVDRAVALPDEAVEAVEVVQAVASPVVA